MKNPFIGLSNKIPTSLNKQNGATMVEYSIMVALIAIVAIFAVKRLGQNVIGTYNSAASSLSVSSTTGGGTTGGNGGGGDGHGGDGHGVDN